MSRRAVVRTGATLAWTLPAVTMVTAAPAFASSHTSVGITDLTASYGPSAPESLQVSATLTGATQPGCTLTLLVPAGLFDDVTCPTATTVSGSLSEGWTLLFQPGGPSFSATLHLGSTSVSPWRGYAGPGFVLTALADAPGAPQRSATTYVAELDRSGDVLAANPGVAAAQDGTLLRLSATGVAVHEAFAGTLGRLVVVVSLPDAAPRPAAAGCHDGWELVAQSEYGGNYLYRYETVQTAHTARTGLAANPDRGPAPDGGGFYEFWAELTTDGDFEGRVARLHFSTEGDTSDRFNRGVTIT